MTTYKSAAQATIGKFADLNGTRLYYEMLGAGPPLVLIHAAIADNRMWDNQFALFATEYRVLRYDVRGYGKSPNPAGEYSDHENLRDLLDYLNIEQTILVGSSHGGKIALDSALSYPERVSALVLADPNISGANSSDEIKRGWAKVDDAFDEGQTAQAIELTLRMWVDGPHRSRRQVNPEVRRHVKEMLTDLYNLPEEADLGTRLPLNPPAITQLDELAVPLLVIMGEKDFADKHRLARLLKSDIPSAKLITMPNTAHLPNLEKPTEFNQAVLDFLREHAPPAKTK